MMVAESSFIGKGVWAQLIVQADWRGKKRAAEGRFRVPSSHFHLSLSWTESQIFFSLTF